MERISGRLHPVGRLEGTLAAVQKLTAKLTGHGKLNGSLSGIGGLSGHLQGSGQITGNLSMPKGKASPAYTGAYEYTPSRSTQTIAIQGYKATENIIINPIPQNYGLITWSGIGIRIS